MAVAEDIKALLLLEVGDTPDSRLSANLDVVWDRWADQAVIAPRLQEYYAKRDLIDLALGYYRTSVDASVGVRALKNNQYYTNLVQMKADVLAQIQRTLAWARANRVPAVGTLTTTTPTVPPFTPNAPPYPQYPIPDANDPVYRGSPYFAPDYSPGDNGAGGIQSGPVD